MRMINNSPLTVLEFNGTTIRICRSVTKNLKRDITHCFSFEAGDFEKDICPLIRSELKARNLKPENVVLSLPRYQVMSHFLRLPSQKEGEIKSMVDLHVLREGGYGKADKMIYDYKLVGFDRQGYALVTIFFIQRNRLERYLRILQQLNIFPVRITLNTQGLLNWSLLQFSLHQEDATRCVFLLNMDHGAFDFNVFANGHVIFSRTFTFAEGSPSDDTQRLAKEVKVSFELFRRMAADVFEWDDTLYITGPPLEYGEDIFQNVFFKQMIRVDPLKNLCVEQSLKYPAGSPCVSYASVLGLALQETRELIDMTPSELSVQIQRRKQRRSMRRLFMGMATGLSIVSLVICGWFDFKINALKKLNSELEALAPIETELRAAKNLAFLERDVLKPYSLVRIFYELYRVTPPSIFISDLDMEENRSLSIVGFSTGLALVFNYLQELKQWPSFADVRLDYVDGKEKQNIKFKIICLTKSNDKKPKML